ncbi:MAG: hypothetical protein K2G29_04555, partial [Muribaculaceae bacterium]|nr:hypothetical protein [Muribaculaceae bacterium]
PSWRRSLSPTKRYKNVSILLRRENNGSYFSLSIRCRESTIYLPLFEDYNKQISAIRDITDLLWDTF